MKYYVRMLGGAHLLAQWAVGEPDDRNPWLGSMQANPRWSITQEIHFIPPKEARAFDTKQGAEQWKLDRIRYRGRAGLPAGRYVIQCKQ